MSRTYRSEVPFLGFRRPKTLRTRKFAESDYVQSVTCKKSRIAKDRNMPSDWTDLKVAAFQELR
jgi:hypothetical protein